MKKMKEYRKRNKDSKLQMMELKCKLRKLCKNKIDAKSIKLQSIIDDIKEDYYSDEEVRSSVSILTLSDAGSVYYPNKKYNSPSKKLRCSMRKMQIGYHHKRTKSRNSDENSLKNDKLDFDAQEVFLPAETLGPREYSDLKSIKGHFNAHHAQRFDFKKLDLYSDEDHENQTPNLRYQIADDKESLNDSVIKVGDLRQSYQMSEIFCASSRRGESPIRGSDIFSRKNDDEVLRSLNFN